jgi:hypothetical protein
VLQPVIDAGFPGRPHPVKDPAVALKKTGRRAPLEDTCPASP